MLWNNIIPVVRLYYVVRARSMGSGWVARDEAVGKDRAQSSRALWAILRNAKSERVERGVCISERHVQG